MGEEVTTLAPKEVGGEGPIWNPATEGSQITPVELNLGGAPAGKIFVALSPALTSRLAVHAPATQAPVNANRLDLLMEVELPVCVSFGRAELPLRDVLKLNSGSIVELNRMIHEPVEIIVNNCVIARGEVVVVEGIYGVRIQPVISREDRLRTLK